VGVGDPREAAFTLVGPIPAGTWTLVGDGIIIEPVDAQFDLIWRANGVDTPIAVWTHHFDPQPTGFDAVAYEETKLAAAVPAQAGDLLVLRYQAMNATVSMAYIPNGDGANSNGRIPNLTLPQ
jgi:hypothetical protein